jgi:hypothetical protein
MTRLVGTYRDLEVEERKRRIVRMAEILLVSRREQTVAADD